MADPCVTPYLTGKTTAVEFSLACGDEDPRNLSYLPVGAMRGKSVTLGGDTGDTTTDSTFGNFRETAMLFKTFEFSGDGLRRADDGARYNQTVLKKHFLQVDNPTAWFRFTYPDITIYAYMLISSFGMEDPYDDYMSYSLEATVTASEYGVIVEDTPAPVTSVSVTPATVTVAEDETVQLSAVTTPTGGSVVWQSINTDVATVDQAGLVTGILEGTTTVRAISGGVVGTATVTVTL